MLDRQADPATGQIRVTFRLPAAAGAQAAWVAGEWNGWSLDADAMAPNDEGELECTLLLVPGRSYRFRYYLGDEKWENDWDADAYVDNEFGGADSVVVLDVVAAEPDSRTGNGAGSPSGRKRVAR